MSLVDRINLQDLGSVRRCVQKGMRSRSFKQGYFAPMEDPSLDIRRYISERIGH